MFNSKIRNYRWLIAALLLVATTINYLDRQIIGLLKPMLEKQFRWTETDFSHIVMAFQASYAIGLISFGWLIDRVGTKIGYALSISIWGLMGMLHAVARSVLGFSLARIGLGLGEAGNYPAAMKAVAEWFPKKERALATGIFNAGTSFGVVLALLITPYILTHYGWQYVFWVTGSIGFIWLIFWLIFYELPAKQKRLTIQELDLITSGQEDANKQKDEIKVNWLKLFTFPQTWAYLVGKLFIDPIYWFFIFWLPSYFATTFKLDLTKLCPELMIIYLATTVGSVGGGYLSSQLIKRGWLTLKARKATLLLFAVLELSVMLVQFAGAAWVAVALLSLAVAVHQAWATNVFTMSSDMFPKQAVSSVVGIGGMAGAIGGIFFPMFIGWLLDSYKTVGNLAGGYNILFTICGCTYLFTLTIIHLLTRNSKQLSLDDLT